MKKIRGIYEYAKSSWLLCHDDGTRAATSFKNRNTVGGIVDEFVVDIISPGASIDDAVDSHGFTDFGCHRDN